MRAFGIVVALLCMGTIVTPTMDSPQAFRKSLFNDGAFANDPFAAHRGAPVSGGSTVTFDYNPDGAAIASGPSNITDALTVNGTAMTIVASYDARNAGATWAASGGSGGTLTRTGSSGALTNVPFTETAARAYDNAGTDYFTGTSTPLIDTEDMAIEFLYYNDGAAMAGGMIQQMAAGTAKGWGMTMGSGSGGLFLFASQNGTVQATVNSATALGLPGWRHVILFWDRSETSGANGVKFYVNGAVSGSGGFINHASIAGTEPFNLLVGGFGGSTTFDGKIGFARVWKCSACMAGGATNATQWLAVAASRFAQLTGTYPAIALGTATPSTATRASTATIDIDRDGDGVVRYFTVADGWIRTARRVDGNAAYIEGAIIEPQSTNLVIQSNALGTTWTPANGAITSNTRADAFGETVLDSYESTDAAGDVAHCDDQAITLTAATYTAHAVFYRTEAVGFALLEDSTIANGKVWFNLSTCATATAQAGVSRSSTKALSSTLCRVSMSFTGTAAAHTIRLCGATADNVATYDDGTNATADWTAGTVQVELQPIHTSPIPTTTATATRVKDVLEFAGAGSVVTGAPGTAEVSLLCDSTGAFGAGYRWGGYADATAANGLYFESDSNQTRAQYFSAAGAAGIASTTTDVPDELIHTLRSTTSTNSHKIYFDTVVGGTVDTAVDLIPTSTITRINIGSNGAASPGGQSTCLYGRTRFWSSSVAP